MTWNPRETERGAVRRMGCVPQRSEQEYTMSENSRENEGGGNEIRTVRSFSKQREMRSLAAGLMFGHGLRVKSGCLYCAEAKERAESSASERNCAPLLCRRRSNRCLEARGNKIGEGPSSAGGVRKAHQDAPEDVLVRLSAKRIVPAEEHVEDHSSGPHVRLRAWGPRIADTGHRA